MPIHHLTSDIVSKIAAGEVIERPCYALKELLENSIDAQSTIIDIEATNAGLDRLAVIDNGVGMSSEDLLLAPIRHTTSKIQSADDLHTISTMGFRGEALASIGAVSTLTLRSKQASDRSGWMLILKHSNQLDHSPVGMSNGTHIIVDHLFDNLPARKKFLRNTQTEYRYLIDIITSIALAYPQLAFSFTHNSRRVLTLPSHESTQRTQSLLGNELYQNLVPINFENEHLHIEGFIGKPQISTHTTQKQFIYINHRRVHSSIITNSIRAAYGTLLESSSQPVFVLFIKLRPEQIDINIHPRKEAVHFLNQSEITQSIIDAVSQALAKHNLTQIDARWQKDDVFNQKSYLHTHLKHTVSNPSANLLREQVLTQYYGSNLKTSSDIIQLHNTYLVTETKEGILLVDQHAAHERILYEKFLSAFENEKQKGESYELEKPLELSLSVSDQELLLQNLNAFTTIGFKFKSDSAVIHAQAGIHPEDNANATLDPVPAMQDQDLQRGDKQSNTFHLTHVPSILKDHPIKQLITEILDDLREDKTPNLDIRSHRMLSYLACRSAIMAGDKLTKERMKSLLEELAQCQTEYTCPHGRPVKVELPLKSMHKLFKRI